MSGAAESPAYKDGVNGCIWTTPPAAEELASPSECEELERAIRSFATRGGTNVSVLSVRGASGCSAMLAVVAYHGYGFHGNDNTDTGLDVPQLEGSTRLLVAAVVELARFPSSSAAMALLMDEIRECLKQQIVDGGYLDNTSVCEGRSGMRKVSAEFSLFVDGYLREIVDNGRTALETIMAACYHGETLALMVKEVLSCQRCALATLVAEELSIIVNGVRVIDAEIHDAVSRDDAEVVPSQLADDIAFIVRVKKNWFQAGSYTLRYCVCWSRVRKIMRRERITAERDRGRKTSVLGRLMGSWLHNCTGEFDVARNGRLKRLLRKLIEGLEESDPPPPEDEEVSQRVTATNRLSAVAPTVTAPDESQRRCVRTSAASCALAAYRPKASRKDSMMEAERVCATALWTSGVVVGRYDNDREKICERADVLIIRCHRGELQALLLRGNDDLVTVVSGANVLSDVPATSRRLACGEFRSRFMAIRALSASGGITMTAAHGKLLFLGYDGHAAKEGRCRAAFLFVANGLRSDVGEQDGYVRYGHGLLWRRLYYVLRLPMPTISDYRYESEGPLIVNAAIFLCANASRFAADEAELSAWAEEVERNGACLLAADGDAARSVTASGRRAARNVGPRDADCGRRSRVSFEDYTATEEESNLRRMQMNVLKKWGLSLKPRWRVDGSWFHTAGVCLASGREWIHGVDAIREAAQINSKEFSIFCAESFIRLAHEFSSWTTRQCEWDSNEITRELQREVIAVIAGISGQLNKRGGSRRQRVEVNTTVGRYEVFVGPTGSLRAYESHRRKATVIGCGALNFDLLIRAGDVEVNPGETARPSQLASLKTTWQLMVLTTTLLAFNTATALRAFVFAWLMVLKTTAASFVYASCVCEGVIRMWLNFVTMLRWRGLVTSLMEGLRMLTFRTMTNSIVRGSRPATSVFHEPYGISRRTSGLFNVLRQHPHAFTRDGWLVYALLAMLASVWRWYLFNGPASRVGSAVAMTALTLYGIIGGVAAGKDYNRALMTGPIVVLLTGYLSPILLALGWFAFTQHGRAFLPSIQPADVTAPENRALRKDSSYRLDARRLANNVAGNGAHLTKVARNAIARPLLNERAAVREAIKQIKSFEWRPSTVGRRGLTACVVFVLACLSAMSVGASARQIIYNAATANAVGTTMLRAPPLGGRWPTLPRLPSQELEKEKRCLTPLWIICRTDGAKCLITLLTRYRRAVGYSAITAPLLRSRCVRWMSS